MKKDITILQSIKLQRKINPMGYYWKWFCRRAFRLGVFFGILAYLCLLFSMDLTGSFMALACLLCFSADNVNRERK